MIGRCWVLILAALLLGAPVAAQPDEAGETAILIRPARVFDGVNPARTKAGRCWCGRADRGGRARTSPRRPARASSICPATTLMPGMIEGHSHLFLHPYNETSWDDQVLHEPLALRTARAVAAARATLMAGFTTARDLGTEGAGYADVGLKRRDRRRASCRGRACSSRPARSSRPAPTAPRAPSRRRHARRRGSGRRRTW